MYEESLVLFMLKYKIVFLSNLYLLLTICTLITSCSLEKDTISHKFKIIELKEYYNGKGAIIPANYEGFAGVPNNKRIDVNLEQIKKAEKILRDDLYNYESKFLHSGRIEFSVDEDTLNQFDELIKKEREQINSYYRHYAGYINNKNEEMIEIMLFNYSTREARSMFKGWQDDIRFITDDDIFQENTRYYPVNLSKGEIEFE